MKVLSLKHAEKSALVVNQAAAPGGSDVFRQLDLVTDRFL
jgi:hypothetical protein